MFVAGYDSDITTQEVVHTHTWYLIMRSHHLNISLRLYSPGSRLSDICQTSNENIIISNIVCRQYILLLVDLSQYVWNFFTNNRNSFASGGKTAKDE